MQVRLFPTRGDLQNGQDIPKHKHTNSTINENSCFTFQF